MPIGTSAHIDMPTTRTRYRRKEELTDEERAVIREQWRQEYAAKRANPASLAKMREKQARSEAKRRAKCKADAAYRAHVNHRHMIWQRKHAPVSLPLMGSVAASAAPSVGRELLLTLMQLAPRCDNRDEIIAEAAYLVCEGASVQDALTNAKKQVWRQAAPYAKTVPLHECYYL